MKPESDGLPGVDKGFESLQHLRCYGRGRETLAHADTYDKSVSFRRSPQFHNSHVGIRQYPGDRDAVLQEQGS